MVCNKIVSALRPKSLRRKYFLMSETSFQEYQDTPANRRELVAFLERPGSLRPPQGTWDQRLTHWWDENPFAALNPYRGRIVYSENRIVGYGGAIPAGYALHGQHLPVLLATTLEVAPEYPKAGLSILLKMRALAEEIPVFHTTPSPKLQHTLEKMESLAETRVRCHFYPCGGLSWLQRRRWPSLDSSVRLVSSVDEVLAVARPFQKADRIEKWRSLESLRWYLATPTREQYLIAAVDASDTLHSFLVVKPRLVRGLPAWDVIDAFTTRDDYSELHALAGCITSDPTLLPQKAQLLTVSAFPDDSTWDATPGTLTREQHVCHHFMMPESLRGTPKHTVMAEGDLVL